MELYTLISIYNNVTYSIALTTLLSISEDCSYLEYITYFCFTFLTGWAMQDIQYFSMIPTVFVSFICLYLFLRDILLAWLYSVTGVFVLLLTIVFVSSTLMLLAPTFVGSCVYQLIMGLIIILSAFIVRFILLRQNRTSWSRKTMKLTILLEIIIIIVFGFILPLLQLPADSVSYPIISLLFIAVIAVVLIILDTMRRTETAKIHAQEQAHLTEILKIQYEDMIKQSHYFGTMLAMLDSFFKREDYTGAETYFSQYLLPVHHEHRQISHEKLQRIGSPVIQSLLEHTADRVGTMKNVTMELSVEGLIRYPEKLLQPILKIMIVCINNALESLDRQKGGTLTIHMDPAQVQIKNTIDNMEYRRYMCRHERTHRGLSIITEAVTSCPELGQGRKVTGRLFIQQIFVAKG